MFKRPTKFVSLILSLLVLFTMVLPTYAQSSDYSGSWASAQISKWLATGVFTGNPDGSFKPANAITRAEFAAVISRLFNYTDTTDTVYSDVAKTAWYADKIDKVTAAGVMQGNDGKFMPNDSISRQEAVLVIYRAFDLKVKNADAINKFVDAGEIAAWSKDAFNAAVENSYITGQPGNIAAPKANITRAECAKLIDNVAGELKNKAGTYTGNIAKNLVVNAKDVILKDMVINGDLFLAQGIGDGNVTLDNVVVKGRTVVRGGGENSIILNNTSLEGTLIIIKKDGKIRIVAQGSTEVSNVELMSGAKLEEDGATGEGFSDVEIIKIEAGQTITLDGDFAEVSIETPGVDVNVISGTVENLVVADTAAGSTVQIAAGATVTTLTADAAVEVSGEGGITTA
ncbi:MAG: S-layer homology domain-containing protein, partial [Ruminiclostridium sp.]|nr:S-layer homology domain-containing protein [Ruminiclostridium sp.]